MLITSEALHVLEDDADEGKLFFLVFFSSSSDLRRLWPSRTRILGLNDIEPFTEM